MRYRPILVSVALLLVSIALPRASRAQQLATLLSGVDAAVAWPNGKAYLFKNGEYYRFDLADQQIEQGYPRTTKDFWTGVTFDAIDAAAVWPDGKAYLFRGTEYIRYDLKADKADEGYPLSIKDHWTGMPFDSIDAAVVWPDGNAYFFKGTQYARYNIKNEKVDDGYPLAIADHWTGLGDRVDDAMIYGKEKAVFFRGKTFLVYDIAKDRVDDGYPKDLSELLTTGFNGSLVSPETATLLKTPARQLSRDDALKLLKFHETLGDVKVTSVGSGKVNLRVTDVPFLYSVSGIKGQKAVPSPPSAIDARLAVGVFRVAKYLRDTWGITELHHGGFLTSNHDNHEQGRGFDFVGAVGSRNGQDYTYYVNEDWAKKTVPDLSNPDGPRLPKWPDNTTNVTYRLLSLPDADAPAREFFLGIYRLATREFQDDTEGPTSGTPTDIGQRSFIMHPDHPSSNPAPNAKNGREAHWSHMHLQVGKTGWE